RHRDASYTRKEGVMNFKHWIDRSLSAVVVLAALAMVVFAARTFGSARDDAEAAVRAKDYPRAFRLYEKAAKGGDAQAQYRIANAYLNGGVTKRDETLAADWYGRSAKQGYAPAETMLGRLALRKKDYRQALQWFQSAASKGDALAEAYLGYFYLFGRAVAKDPVKAAQLFGDSARKGNADAQYQIGILLLNGAGVKKDPAKGLQSIRLAAGAGEPGARQFLRTLAERKKHKGGGRAIGSFLGEHRKSA